MQTSIHPTAVVSSKAQIGAGVEIGPYAYIGEGVKIGDYCIIHPHAVLKGQIEIGPENEFYSFCVIGEKSQDLKYQGEPTYLKIGKNNVFREFSTVHRSTFKGQTTEIGSYNHFLAYTHIAHDCRIGDWCVFSNNATLAGHVVVEDHVTIGGLSAVHQFCRIGRFSMIGGCTKVVQDVIPFSLVDGNPAKLRSLNLVGLKRNHFSEAQIKSLKFALKLLLDGGLNISQALEELEKVTEKTQELMAIIRFIKDSERGVIR
ncbi:acyl-[acyl-carrier-protein]--UDP-N-acetylglucosamine O-acyltransferase [Methylacidiphilum sp. Yel]|jgi:UDP-N-acetylglucosamine acyltransferase|uniref:acyl-ACP--UDP-N-acetylglucosamine O-acyltransferase n=1 Tax=Methylacidiphilum sp. Yel TaxID=1847730 RepID=UPI00106AF516|nr:acyl-ACP--UDP-N-acetylglucosamine O-acyltransferase [Methylacidiphilum sp. Yel]TFE66519.1 acyl-[acyl-carrier-protein]--UDP-N-acetylglucosamine O-acyltransferase [Methylacidiphilum sp. Yel]